MTFALGENLHVVCDGLAQELELSPAHPPMTHYSNQLRSSAISGGAQRLRPARFFDPARHGVRRGWNSLPPCATRCLDLCTAHDGKILRFFTVSPFETCSGLAAAVGSVGRQIT